MKMLQMSHIFDLNLILLNLILNIFEINEKTLNEPQFRSQLNFTEYELNHFRNLMKMLQMSNIFDLSLILLNMSLIIFEINENAPDEPHFRSEVNFTEYELDYFRN